MIIILIKSVENDKVKLLLREFYIDVCILYKVLKVHLKNNRNVYLEDDGKLLMYITNALQGEELKIKTARL